jgi:predicted nucleic acid-binding protein
LSVYDASYLALALALGSELVTLDAKLAHAAEALRG